MGLTTKSPGLSIDVKDAGWNVFRRGCVECPPVSPSCPQCPAGQVCSLVPQSCTACASMTCVANGQTPASQSSTGGSSANNNSGGGGGSSQVSSVAGGVVGGLGAIALVGFLLYFFVMRPRKKRALEAQRRRSAWTVASSEKSSGTMYQSRPGTQLFQPQAQSQQQQQQQQQQQLHLRQSQMSGGSRPLSGMTTTSNHIPIGFIDGVRGVPGSDIPIPPIPSAGGYPGGQDIYFAASDIYKRDTQDTAYFTTGAGRQSITPSLDGRSIASGVFQEDGRDNPMPTVPALAISLQRPQVVSVKPGSKPASPTETGTARHVFLPGSAIGELPASAASATAATFVRPTITTINRSNSKKVGRSPSTNSRTRGDSAQDSTTAEHDESPVRLSATATQPVGTDLNSENANSVSSSKVSRTSPNPFGDEHASD